ncbi:thiamine pyrophosphate-binding protein [Novosphingobium sp.]|uniref:thiamine pyrophosphate-binding protein n=1 Tax=Novosphingobium sp. TaxID=1874826 RepID=UPI003529E8C5
MTKVRLSDYVARRLHEHGVRHVFMLTGGGAMHLNDAMGRVDGLQYVCCHHEQALAMAAESYTRLSGRLAALNVTTGPGGINSLNGVHGAYTDSIAMIVVSGQVKRETLASNAPVRLRQLGDQEVDIVSMVKPITKFAAMVTDPLDIRYLLEKALWLAETGRPGPVWLDIPIDVQAAPIDPDELHGFNPRREGYGRDFALPAEYGWLTGAELEEAARRTVAAIREAKRPVLLPGTGIRISGQYERFLAVADKLGIGVAPAWNAQDLVPEDHPLYVGRPGTVGDRPGNFAVQNADCVLVLGCRLNIRQISYNFASFARAAKKIMVDVDAAELAKPTIAIDMPIHANLKDFLPALERALEGHETPAAHKAYVDWAMERRRKYHPVLPEYWETRGVVNPYCFTEALFEQLSENEVIVMADATAAVVTVQAARLKHGQRLYSNSGAASMGYDLPATIGAWHAMQTMSGPAGAKRIICMAGDGSIMQNLQELQTIAGQRIPAKIFLYNNSGYHSIRQSQQSHFAGFSVGCGPDSGVSFPDFEKVAAAFGFAFTRTSDHSDIRDAVRRTLDTDGPAICEIMVDKEQVFAPKLSSKRLDDGTMVTAPLEDLAPFLPREEFEANMLIPLMS